MRQGRNHQTTSGKFINTGPAWARPNFCPIQHRWPGELQQQQVRPSIWTLAGVRWRRCARLNLGSAAGGHRRKYTLQKWTLLSAAHNAAPPLRSTSTSMASHRLSSGTTLSSAPETDLQSAYIRMEPAPAHATTGTQATVGANTTTPSRPSASGVSIDASTYYH